jgi:hypothetical protein
LQRLPPRARRFIETYGWVDFDGYVSKDAFLLSGDHDRFTNHADSPNTICRENDMVAARPIPAGEELTCDYRDHYPDWERRVGRAPVGA